MQQPVYVYRCHNKADTFVFLAKKDNVDILPSELVNLLGELSFSFEFMLDKNKKLMQADAVEVLKAINEQGFYLQLSSKSKTEKDDKLDQFYRR